MCLEDTCDKKTTSGFQKFLHQSWLDAKAAKSRQGWGCTTRLAVTRGVILLQCSAPPPAPATSCLLKPSLLTSVPPLPEPSNSCYSICTLAKNPRPHLSVPTSLSASHSVDHNQCHSFPTFPSSPVLQDGVRQRQGQGCVTRGWPHGMTHLLSHS